LYETQDKYHNLDRKFLSLNSFFNKFKNISFPTSYLLNFYEPYSELPVIYLITPNYYREAQLADLKTLINTLWIVPKVVWIVIEDSANKTFRVQKILKSSNLSFVHLNVATPEENKVKKGEKSWSKPRGVLQRNEGLKWLRDHSNELQRGVIYFMDDDNRYDIRLFEEVS
jgi:galactosylgalactosylxylosylprotein 3-beta-glucuronosyltransferase 3